MATPELIFTTIYLLIVGLCAWATIAQFIGKISDYQRDDQRYSTPLIPSVCKAIWPTRRTSEPTFDILKCTALAWFIPFAAAVIACSTVVLILDGCTLLRNAGKEKTIS